MMAKRIKNFTIQKLSLQRSCSIWTSDNYLDDQSMSAAYFNNRLKTKGTCSEECTIWKKMHKCMMGDGRKQDGKCQQNQSVAQSCCPNYINIWPYNLF